MKKSHKRQVESLRFKRALNRFHDGKISPREYQAAEWRYLRHCGTREERAETLEWNRKLHDMSKTVRAMRRSADLHLERMLVSIFFHVLGTTGRT